MAKVADRLQKEFGESQITWDAQIPLGQSWRKYLETELARSQYVLFFVGPGWLTSSFARGELLNAFENKKALIPIVLKGRASWSEVPPELSPTMGAELDLSKLEQSLDQLVQRLRSTVSAESPPQPGPITDPDDPQKGRWGGWRNGTEGSCPPPWDGLPHLVRDLAQGLRRPGSGAADGEGHFSSPLLVRSAKGNGGSGEWDGGIGTGSVWLVHRRSRAGRRTNLS